METVEPIRSKKQIDNMKRYLKETSLRNWLLFTLGINSGLRIGDLLQLTVEEVKDCERISNWKGQSLPLIRYLQEIHC